MLPLPLPFRDLSDKDCTFWDFCTLSCIDLLPPPLERVPPEQLNDSPRPAWAAPAATKTIMSEAKPRRSVRRTLAAAFFAACRRIAAAATVVKLSVPIFLSPMLKEHLGRISAR